MGNSSSSTKKPSNAKPPAPVQTRGGAGGAYEYNRYQFSQECNPVPKPRQNIHSSHSSDTVRYPNVTRQTSSSSPPPLPSSIECRSNHFATSQVIVNQGSSSNLNGFQSPLTGPHTIFSSPSERALLKNNSTGFSKSSATYKSPLSGNQNHDILQSTSRPSISSVTSPQSPALSVSLQKRTPSKQSIPETSAKARSPAPEQSKIQAPQISVASYRRTSNPPLPAPILPVPIKKSSPSPPLPPTVQKKTPTIEAADFYNLTISNTASTTSTKQNPGSGQGNTQKKSEGASLADLLNQHQAQKDQDIEQKRKEKEQEKRKQIASLVPKPIFNLKNVPRVIQEQKKALPIYAFKDKLLKAIKTNQMVIVIGETGSGKSTQIPQYIAEAGLHGTGKIAVTQPRRVAAKSVASRVAVECGVKLGTSVGYSVRFDRSTSDHTVIKYLTDGLLVKECATEANLDTYSVIIIDEAHERSIHTDVCFGLLKRAAEKRSDLKIIISSATLEEEKFSKYFNNAPVFKVGGKLHTVDILYNPKGECEYLAGAVDTIFSINRKEGTGDILVFLSGQDEIDHVWEMLDNKLKDSGNSLHDTLLITPCCGSMPFEEQQKIFEPTPKNHRKVVLATNIAETSLTIDGIKYVIDCGYFKQNEYNPKSGIYSLVLKRITKFQAIQRAGRAGRTQPGKCYRLYRQYDFTDTMQNATTPEITRCNVESVILDIIAMDIPNPLEFPFMDPPSRDAIMEALQHLKELSALDSNLNITNLGRRMSEFPLAPHLAKVLIESEKLGCEQEVLKIVAMLSIQYQNIFKRGKKYRKESDEVRKSYQNTDGDLLTLLKIYDTWVWNNYSEKWCWENYLQYRHLCDAEEIRQQLEDILKNKGMSSMKRSGIAVSPNSSEMKGENIRRAFTAGYFRQIARKKARGHAYQTLGNVAYVEDVFLHPSSALFSCSHPFVIYHEVLNTSKAFIRGVIKIEASWVREYAPDFADKYL